MKALILAAGFGTRLRPYTDHTPKPLFSVAGRPLLDIWVRKLARAGCEAVAVNTHHLHGKIADHVARQSYEIPVMVRHEPDILDTGGAIRNMADFWDDRPFMVVNSDVLTDLDLQAVYAFHRGHAHPVTLVLCNDPTFNHVSVNGKGCITAFHAPETAPDEVCRAFTGIQVADPELLDYIPDGVPFSSIDAYRRMLADGCKIRAFMPDQLCWQDLGTPERYRAAVVNQMGADAFRKARSLPPQSVQRVRLKGDGSDRGWYRLSSGGRTLIMADHGIRRQPGGTAEVDAFVEIGLHLRRKGIPVPEIHLYEPFAGLVFLEDLGDMNLQAFIRKSRTSDAVLKAYQGVIDRLIHLCLAGREGFDPAWTCQTPHYDRDLILERECRYFTEAFLQGYAGQRVGFEDLEAEFGFLAENALRFAVTGFMHRDMQSRNIMVRGEDFYFIDFQGGRMGPLQYDLASLLIDPYVNLSRPVQARLVRYCLEKLADRITVEPEQFMACYAHCALCRNLQMLGAFGFLSRVRKKIWFEQYIPPALENLNYLLSGFDQRYFPRLRQVVSGFFSDQPVNKFFHL